MGLLEDEIRNRFSDKESLDGVDSSGIWDVVSAELDASGASRPTGYLYKSRIIGVLLLIGGLGLGYILYESDSKEELTEVTVHTDQGTSNSAINRELIKDEQEVQIGPELSALSESSIINKEEVQNYETNSDAEGLSGIELSISTPDKSTDERIGHGNLEIEKGQPKEPSMKGVVGNSDSNPRVDLDHGKKSGNDPIAVSAAGMDNIEKIDADLSQTLETGHSELKGDRIFSASSANNPFQLVSDLDAGLGEDVMDHMLPLGSKIGRSQLDRDVRPMKLVGDLDPYCGKRGFRPYEISLLLGSNFSEQDLNDISALSESSLQGSEGASTGLVATWKNSVGIRLSVGVTYDLFHVRFNLDSQRDVLFLEEDRLTNFELDEVTGDTINAVYQDTWMNAVESRTIRHSNQYQMLSVPISLGYEKDFGRVGLGIDVGASYGIVISQSGRAIDQEGSIQGFDSQEGGKLPISSGLMFYHVKPHLDYQITDMMCFRFSPEYHRSTKATSDFHGADQNISLVKLTGGLVFTLK